MRINDWTFSYAFGFTIVFTGLRTYYKKQEVFGLENVPKNKPVLFAANHQNAFIDPVSIAVPLYKPAHFMVRADIFKKPAVGKVLRSLNMMPIFRQRDGGNTVKKNEKVFDHCYNLLKNNKPIVIFVEGNQGGQKRLRPIQKGLFRIGFGAENKFNNELDVHVVPVGIYYSEIANMGSKMLVNYGKPIRMAEYLEQFKESEASAYSSLKNELGIRLNKCMIDIQNTEYYDTIHDMMFIVEKEIFEKEGKKGNRLIDEFHCQKGFIEKTEDWITKNPTEAIGLKSNVEAFNAGEKKLNLKAWLFQKEKQNPFLAICLLIIGFPIHLYGMINNYIPYKLPAFFADKKIKDIHFHSSIKMAMGVLLFWIFWGIQISLVAIFTDHYIWLYYFGSLIISAWFSYHYWITILKTKGKLTYNKLSKNKDARFLKLKESYAFIGEVLEKIYK